jgi:flagellar hook assembly protein FlgD
MGKLVLRREFSQGADGGMVGLNEIEWDGRNGDGSVVASGGYIVLIEAVRNGETINSMRRRIGVVR